MSRTDCKEAKSRMSNNVYTIQEIRNLITPVALKHGIEKVYLFGSYARGSATASSDIDLCIDSKNIRGLFALGGIYADFEAALNKELDLITLKSLQHNEDKQFLDNLRKKQVLIYESK